MKTAALLIVLVNPAWAECGGYEGTFLTCEIEGGQKVLSVCYDDEFAIYRFRPKDGPPELELHKHISTLNYTPWPGVGRAIWDEVVFSNKGYTYTVVAGLDRDFPEEHETAIGERLFGGGVVDRSGVEVADLSCDTESVYTNNLNGLTWAKNQLGYVWDAGTQTWEELPD
ncbi:MAG: hypothetical protein P8P56_10270 [Yoonia sp.]|nr:hypothetical protein [Yoonia sp.]